MTNGDKSPEQLVMDEIVAKWTVEQLPGMIGIITLFREKVPGLPLREAKDLGMGLVKNHRSDFEEMGYRYDDGGIFATPPEYRG